jgi:hypothetical protein
MPKSLAFCKKDELWVGWDLEAQRGDRIQQLAAMTD